MVKKTAVQIEIFMEIFFDIKSFRESTLPTKLFFQLTSMLKEPTVNLGSSYWNGEMTHLLIDLAQISAGYACNIHFAIPASSSC